MVRNTQDDKENKLPRAGLRFAQWLLMTLENCHEATLPIPEISGRLKIFVECWWILIIDHHGLTLRLESGGG